MYYKPTAFEKIEIKKWIKSNQNLLFSLIYILYTNNFRSQHADRHIISLLDDSEMSHGPVVDDFVSWCEERGIFTPHCHEDQRRVLFFVDFPLAPQSSVIDGQSVEFVTNYKYHGIILDHRLKFDLSTEMVCQKGQQHLFCLRELAKFQVDRSLIILFYRAFIDCPFLPFAGMATSVSNKRRMPLTGLLRGLAKSWGQGSAV